MAGTEGVVMDLDLEGAVMDLDLVTVATTDQDLEVEEVTARVVGELTVRYFYFNVRIR